MWEPPVLSWECRSRTLEMTPWRIKATEVLRESEQQQNYTVLWENMELSHGPLASLASHTLQREPQHASITVLKRKTRLIGRISKYRPEPRLQLTFSFIINWFVLVSNQQSKSKDVQIKSRKTLTLEELVQTKRLHFCIKTHSTRLERDTVLLLVNQLILWSVKYQQQKIYITIIQPKSEDIECLVLPNQQSKNPKTLNLQTSKTK